VGSLSNWWEIVWDRHSALLCITSVLEKNPIVAYDECVMVVDPPEKGVVSHVLCVTIV